MNERIKQLAARSNFGHMENGEVVYDRRLEKFAELIIYECMEINQQELAFNALSRVRERYEKHFGIDIET